MIGKTQYRVVWKRDGYKEKTKLYWSKHYARRFLAIMGPEPWLALGKGPDDLFCCKGYMCNCGGVTWQEALIADRANMPVLEYAFIEQRQVIQMEWEALK